jgi:hypothetical protein
MAGRTSRHSDPIGRIQRAIQDALSPEPVLLVSEWADRHRILPAKGSAEPGPWRTSRTPYLRAIMDALATGSPYHTVVFATGSQIGASEAGNNLLSYAIHHAPAPMLLVQPTVEMVKRMSKQRIQPMIDATPMLADPSHMLPVIRQCALLDLSRSSVYYTPQPVAAEDLALMRRIDELHLNHPFAGARMRRALLALEGMVVGRRHVATLMKTMRIAALYRRPNNCPGRVRARS